MIILEKERWVVVGNICKEIPTGHCYQTTKSGTRLLSGGTKVYIVGGHFGMAERLTVIGRCRHGKNFIFCDIDARYIENLRVKVIYNPKVLNMIDNSDNYKSGLINAVGTQEDVQKTLQYVQSIIASQKAKIVIQQQKYKENINVGG